MYACPAASRASALRQQLRRRLFRPAVECLEDRRLLTADFGFALRTGGANFDAGHSVAVDTMGNAYVTGEFRGTVDFDPGVGVTNLSSSNGSSDSFVAKYSPTGALLWANRLGGNGSEIALGITVDSLGNVHSTGRFEGTADFDPGAGSFNLTSAGSGDIYVSKLDSSGNFVWARSLGGGGFDQAFGIAVDDTGNVYTTGLFVGTGDFDPGAGIFNLTSAGGNDVFVSKLNAAGDFIWARRMGGGSFSDRANSIDVDAAGNIFTTGQFEGTADFDPGVATFNLTSVGNQDVFISKLNSAGDFIWAQALRGSGSDEGLGIAVDDAGNVHTAGFFQSTVDFDPGLGIFNLTSAGSEDIYVSKLDNSGNFLWARRLGGVGSDVGRGIALDSLGNVYTPGRFFGTVDFDPGAALFNLTSAGDQDVFISKLNSVGDFVWAMNMGGAGFDYGHAIAVGNSSSVYTTGAFAATADFDPGAGVFNLTSAGNADMFLSQLTQVAGTLSADLVGDHLRVADVSPTGRPNKLTITTSGGDLIVSDAVEQFIAAPLGGVLSNGNRTLTIPLALVAKLTADGADGDDLFTVGPLGILKDLNLLGGDGDDLFGSKAQPFAPNLVTTITVDGGNPPTPVTPTGDGPGDVLNLDVSLIPTAPSWSHAGLIVSTTPGVVIASGYAGFAFSNVEDINLCENGELTNVQMGDLFFRGTDGNDLILFSQAGNTSDPLRTKLRFNSQPILYFTLSGKTVVYGAGGSDYITQSNVLRPAEFYGEAGDDYLSGAMNNDWLVGGDGNDRINGSGGDNVIWGDNSPTSAAPTPQNAAIGGDDQLSGLGGNDVFYGSGGNDLVSAGGGNDYLHGGAGNDTLDGHDGDNRLYGGLGNDILSGSNGNDLLSGAEGDDKLYGQAGNDVLFGGTGLDLIDGGDGNDLLVSGSLANENSSWTSLANTSTYSAATYTNPADNDAVLIVLLAQWGTFGNRGTLGNSPAITHDGQNDDLWGSLGDDDFCWETADVLDNPPGLAPPDFLAFGKGTDERFGPT